MKKRKDENPELQTPEENGQKTPGQPQNDQQPETDKLAPGEEKVVLIVDLEGKNVQAFKNEKETLPFNPENQSEFLKIDRSSILENFASNFSRQYEDPKRFKILALPARFLDAAFKTIDKLFQLRPAENLVEFYNKHTINDPELLKSQNPNGEATDNTKKRRYIDEGMVNWEQIKKELGVSREFLANKGYLDILLRGGKTPETVPINMDLGFIKLKGEARLNFQFDKVTGEAYLDAQTPKAKPELDGTYYGHTFTKKEKEELIANRRIEKSIFLNVDKGEKARCIVGLDPATNEVVSVRADYVTIPDEKFGMKFSEQDKEFLRNGGEMRVEGLISGRGNEFPGTFYIDPNTRRFEMKFDSQNIFERKTLGGVQLTEEQLENLKNQVAIRVDNMLGKSGDPFSRFVKLNEATNQPEFFKFNPDAPADSREIIVPEYVSGKKIPQEDIPAFAAGTPIFVEGMYKVNGEPMDRFIQLNLENGNIKYATKLEDFHKTLDETMEQKEFNIPSSAYGHTFKASELADLRAEKTVKITDMVGFDGIPLNTKWLKADMKTGTLRYYNENPDLKEKNTISQKQGQEQSKGRGVA